MKHGGGLALIISKKIDKGDHDGMDYDKEEDGDMMEGKAAAMKEFHEALESEDHEAMAKAMGSFVNMCRYTKDEE